MRVLVFILNSVDLDKSTEERDLGSVLFRPMDLLIIRPVRMTHPQRLWKEVELGLTKPIGVLLIWPHISNVHPLETLELTLGSNAVHAHFYFTHHQFFGLLLPAQKSCIGLILQPIAKFSLYLIFHFTPPDLIVFLIFFTI